MNLSTSIPLAAGLSILAQLALKATLVLMITAAVSALLWRASAASRHMVWCVGVIGVLALPVFSLVIPAWEVPVLPAAAVVKDAPLPAAPSAAPSVRSAALPSSSAQPAAVVPAGEWVARAAALLALAGVLVGVLWLAVGFWGANRVGRRAQVVRDPEWLRASQDAADGLGLRRPVLLLRGRGADMPATWGLLWPSVIVPSVADGWPDDRRRAVLAHELAHVKRFDCLTQALAQAACVLFWWHPAVWYAARRLRIERERACDDLVLRAGARASDYAAHLLEVARSHKAMRFAGPAMVSMARPSHLESRLLWVLDGARARGVPSAAAMTTTLLAGLMIVAPLSAMRPAARPATVDGGAPVAVAADKWTPAGNRAPGWIGTLSPAERAGLPAAAQTDTPPAHPRGDRAAQRLAAMRAVGVTPEYVEEMRAAGLGALDADALIGMAANGVTRAWVDELRGLGFTRLTAADVTGMRALGVDAAYVGEMRRAGFAGLSTEQIVQLRAVGVTEAWVRELAAAGVTARSADELVQLRAVGVTAGWIAGLRAENLVASDVDELTELRSLGVGREYVRELRSVGLDGLSVQELSELKALDVTAEYVRRLRASGFDAASADELVRLRGARVEPRR